MRFVAVIGPTEKINILDISFEGLPALATELPIVGRRPDFILRCDDEDEITSIPDGGGFIIGSLFARDGDVSAPLSLLRTLSIASKESIGRTLIDHFWGSYVAFVSSRQGLPFQVLRSPLGSLSVYHIEHAGCLITTNDVRLLARVGWICPTIDWVGVTGHLLAGHVRPESTAISHVSELTGGSILTFENGETREGSLWQPWAFASGLDTPGEQIATKFRETVDHVVGAWASRSQNILLALSGGLDSSIVAAALAGAHATFSCVNLVSGDSSGDERRYAEMVAAHVKERLYCRWRDVRRIDVTRSHAAHLPRPVARSFSQESDRIQQELGREIGATAYFSGGAGDNVFGFQSSVAPLVDRIRMQGIGRASHQTASALGAMTGVSQLVIWRKAIARLLNGRIAFKIPLDASLLTPDAVELGRSRASHSWLCPPPNMLPGKAAHVALIHFALNYLEGFERERYIPNVAPLLSQPIVEHSLSIPSWTWFRDGWNRVVARDAYRDALPPEIVYRRSKGAPDSFAVEIFERNHETMRSMLVEGKLAENRIIDRRAVEAAFRASRIPRGPDFWRLMSLTDVEAWIRTWSS